jgi:hypothetical protein
MMTDTQTEMETVEITMPGYQLGGALRAVAHAMYTHVGGDYDPIVFVAEGPPLTCVVMPRSL